MRNTKIKTKLGITFFVAGFAALIIGVCGYFSIFQMNETITYNDFNIVKPMANLDRITFSSGQINILVRDIILDENSDEKEKRFELIRDYQEELRKHVNDYLETMSDSGDNDSDEYALLSELSLKAVDWSNEVENVARFSFNGQDAAALEQLYGAVIPKGDAVNRLIDELVTINQNKATQRRVNSQEHFIFSTVLIIGLVLLVTAIMSIMGTMVTRSITKSVRKIVDSAEDFADGNIHVYNEDLHYSEDLPDDEMRQIARALKRMADSIANLMADNYQVIVEAGAGQIDARVDTTKYKGDYRKILDGINMTFETFCHHLDAVPAAISFFDLSGEFVYGNKVIQELLSRLHFSVSNKNLLSQLLTSGKSNTLPKEAADIFSESEDIDSFYTTVMFQGETDEDVFTYGLTLHRVFGVGVEYGKSSCVMLTMVDITEVTNAKSDAERANRAKTDFLSHMSHEIRTPMNAIIGMAQIADRTDDLDKIKECIKRIERSSHHLLGVLNDILDMSKIEAGKLALSEEEISLSEDIPSIISMMKSKENERNIEITYNINIKNDIVMADGLRLNQVLINILSNAIKFSPENSQIYVSVEETEEQDSSLYQFSIEDHGIGMNEEQINRLFKSFEQADVSISRRFGGTGLGLAISKSIIEMMGGEIWVESEVDKGSIFHFTARLTPIDKMDKSSQRSKALPEKEDNNVNYDFSELRALIVDDIDINRMILIELLSEANIEMEEASNGREAVNMFTEAPAGYYDVILMDLQMPEMDGYEATEKIRDMNRSDSQTVAIIALSANVIKEDIERAFDAGMNGHIAKPVNIRIAMKTIYEICIEDSSIENDK